MSELRFAIMALLLQAKSMSFRELLEATDSSRGNLSVQLKKLKSAGYLHSKRELTENSTLTTCTITEKGEEALYSHLEALKEMIQKKN